MIVHDFNFISMSYSLYILWKNIDNVTMYDAHVGLRMQLRFFTCESL